MNIKLSVFAIASLLLSGMALAQNNPPTWSATASYNEGDVVKIGINLYRALSTNSNKNPVANSGAWELYRLRANNLVSPAVYRINVGVGQTFPDLYYAWRYAQNAVIDQGATLQFYINTSKGAFSETFPAAFSLDHPSGSQIQIVGDNPSNVNLTFPGKPNAQGFAGIFLDGSHTLQLLENVTITAQNSGATNGAGVSLDTGASLTMQGVTINGFYDGIGVYRSSRLNVSALTLNGFTYGIYAVDHAYVCCPNISITGNPNTITIGIDALKQSEIDADGASLSNVGTGMNSSMNSTISAIGSTCSGTMTCGYYAIDRGVIDATNGTGVFYEAVRGGLIEAQGSNSVPANTAADSISYVLT